MPTWPSLVVGRRISSGGFRNWSMACPSHDAFSALFRILDPVGLQHVLPGLARVRAHRGIGNSLHWVLDATVNEDRQRTGEGNGAENMAMMRRMALNMAGGMAEKKKTSMRSRLERAGWNNDFLLEIIQVASCGMAEHEKIQER